MKNNNIGSEMEILRTKTNFTTAISLHKQNSTVLAFSWEQNNSY